MGKPKPLKIGAPKASQTAKEPKGQGGKAPRSAEVDAAGGGEAQGPREAFESGDHLAAFEHFSKIVEGMPSAKLPVCKLDVVLVRHNATRGLTAIRPHLETLRAAMPGVSIPDLLEIPSIANALLFSAGQIHREASRKEIAARLKSLRPLRRMALTQLEIFAELGLVSKAVTQHIRRGYGPYDAAADAVHIASVFRAKRAPFAGKHPFTQEQIDALSIGGTWLMTALKPKGTRRVRARNPSAILRDKLFALLRERYDHLQRAAAWIFGLRKANAHVPPLGACKRPRKRAAEKETDTPTPAGS